LVKVRTYQGYVKLTAHLGGVDLNTVDVFGLLAVVATRKGDPVQI